MSQRASEHLTHQQVDLTRGARGWLRSLQHRFPELALPRLALRAARIDHRVNALESLADVPLVRETMRELVGQRPLRILALLRLGGWEEHNLLPALRRFGEVELFELPRADTPGWLAGGRQALNRDLLARFERMAGAGGVDLVFAYASGWYLETESLLAMRDARAKVFSFSLDDRLGFSTTIEGGEYGMREIAPALDLAGTSTSRCLGLYAASGGRAMFFPEAADPDVFVPDSGPSDPTVVFVGVCYGWRPWLVRRLQRSGLQVAAHGPGWPRGPASLQQMVRAFGTARVVLGIGGIQQSLRTTCLKGRDFEVPMCGGVYVAQADEDLVGFGGDLLAASWTTPREMVERVREVASWPEDRRRQHRGAVAALARERHTWAHRVAAVLAALELPNPTLGGPAPVHAWPSPVIVRSGARPLGDRQEVLAQHEAR